MGILDEKLAMFKIFSKSFLVGNICNIMQTLLRIFQ